MNIRDDLVRQALINVLKEAELPLAIYQATIAGEVVVFENVGAAKGRQSRILPDGRLKVHN